MDIGGVIQFSKACWILDPALEPLINIIVLHTGLDLILGYI
jgi:hypothetical protein